MPENKKSKAKKSKKQPRKDLQDYKDQVMATHHVFTRVYFSKKNTGKSAIFLKFFKSKIQILPGPVKMENLYSNKILNLHF